MSAPAPTAAVTSVDNDLELAALERMVRLADGFTLGFARANHGSLRRRLTAALRARLAPDEVAEIALTQEGGDAVAQLERAAGGGRPALLLVEGLDGLLNLAGALEPALDLLNLNREFLARRLPFPVVFWVADFSLREVARRAPDLWSWRSGSYRFLGEDEDLTQTLGETAAAPSWRTAPAARRARGEALRALLAEASGLDSARRARTHQLLGELEGFESRWNDARLHLEAALAAYREIGARLGEANCIQSLGDVARMQSRYDDAQRAYEQALPIYRQIGDRLGEAGALRSQARLVSARNRPAEAGALFAEAERIYAAIGLDAWAARVREEGANLITVPE